MSHLVEMHIHYWKVLLDHYTLFHAIDEDVSHWRRSGWFQNLDLGLHYIIWGHPSFRSNNLLIECPNFHQIHVTKCKVVAWFPTCGYNRNFDKRWWGNGLLRVVARHHFEYYVPLGHCLHKLSRIYWWSDLSLRILGRTLKYDMSNALCDGDIPPSWLFSWISVHVAWHYLVV